MNTRPVYIIGSTRTPFVKSMTHYLTVPAEVLITTVLRQLINQYHLEGQLLGDVALGSVMNDTSNWNFARECVLATELDPHTPAYTLQRYCGTSLETTLQLALKIANHQIDCGISGGVDSNSDITMTLKRSLTQKLMALRSAKTSYDKLKCLSRLRPSDLIPQFPTGAEPQTHLSMGQHCEKMVKQWNISRQAQDELALLSHQNGEQAYQRGFYHDLVLKFNGLERDAILRADTTLDKLARLKPAFDASAQGTITAGNSSPLTDGAAAVFLASAEYAHAVNLPVLARFVDAQVAAVDYVHGDGLLMAPTIAVSELLKRQNLSLQDFDVYEIHEAFAGQVLCTLAAWESPEYCRRVLQRDLVLGSIDRSKLNINGGSVALGHPFAATGARIVGGLAKILYQQRGRGLISICTAGGMGVAAIIESV